MPPKYRIPRVAVAALVLGACGDDNGGVDVSDSRFRSVAESYCKHYARCYPDDFSDEYGTLAACVNSIEEALQEVFREYAGDDDECLDAYLDYYECSAQLACDEDDDQACAAESAAAELHCHEPSDDYADYLTRSPQQKPFKSFRIPR